MNNMICRGSNEWTVLNVTGNPPSPRFRSSMVVWNDSIIIFGGFDGRRSNSLYMLNMITLEWSFIPCSGNIPEERSHHSAHIINGSEMLIFGGMNNRGEVLSDTHILDLDELIWTTPVIDGNSPPARIGHACEVFANTMLIFGGFDPHASLRYNDLYLLLLDTKVMTWTQPIVLGEVPQKRYEHVSISLGDKVIIFGGDEGKEVKNDIHIFDFATMRWARPIIEGHGPPGRASLVANVIGDVIYFHGGRGKDKKMVFDDVWCLDISNIQELQEGFFNQRGRDIGNTFDNAFNSIAEITRKKRTKSKRLSLEQSIESMEIWSHNAVQTLVQQVMNQMSFLYQKLTMEKRLLTLRLKNEEKQIDSDVKQFEEFSGKMEWIQQTQKHPVTLNIGGKYFYTSFATLTRIENSMFHAMFSGIQDGLYPHSNDTDGSYFIDRDNTYFSHILAYLRDETLPEDLQLYEIRSLLQEANYYQLEILEEYLETSIAECSK
eukprot:TRINITY_DN5189_c0_g1_i2.p1 TRINITY_DN5189_c0_g1~~TRINITY_DN5189_c0_g1_i2.p1  ORF type:complete len:490 (-),score=99.55 TRINITY_DN5189_c0_g1_i2:23-1492(-)